MTCKYFLGLSLAFWAVCGPAVASKTDAPDRIRARAAFSEALAAHEAGDNESAITLLKEARLKRPHHPQTLSVLAQIEALSGDKEAALKTLADLAALQVSPGDITQNENYASLAADPRFLALAERFTQNAAPKGEAARFAVTPEKTALIESLAWDGETETLFLGSMAERKILKRDKEGNWSPFAEAAPHGLYSVAGMKLDPRAGILWAASPATDVTPDLKEGEEGRTAIFGFDVETGRLAHKAELKDEAPHWFGDLIVLDNGNLLISDSLSSTLYLYDVAAKVILPYLTDAHFVSPQGLVMGPDDTSLFVADYATGLFEVNLMDGAVTPLEPGLGVVPYGIDGLYRYGDDLIAIQNGTSPQRVTRLTVDLKTMRLTSQEVLVQTHADHFEPTLGQVVDGKFLYVANSAWPLFGGGKQPAEDDLAPTVILSVDLE
ncbi:MAG: hypothetical protein EP340_01790 [Alphaproteobacteria bacterium]|nr:MAG: hypothetical protein EP340_01790 [Alphaproteobacteria bacterium]